MEGAVALSREEEEAMTRADIYWFFRRKLKVVLLTVMTYAALC